MQVSERHIHILAASVLGALLDQGLVHLIVSREDATERIRRLLLENFRAEEALEEEAEGIARQHARQTAGMDQHKIIQGIKERLAKERGFTL
jgi:hypothetical protein